MDELAGVFRTFLARSIIYLGMISKTQISIVIFWCRRIADRSNQQYLTRWKRGVAEDERKSKQRHQSRHSAAEDRGPFQATSRGGDKEGQRIND